MRRYMLHLLAVISIAAVTATWIAGCTTTQHGTATSTRTPATSGSWVDKAVLPPGEEAKIRAWLRADDFKSVYSELNRLSQSPKYRANPRVVYLGMKAMILEIGWTRSLPAGNLHNQEQTSFLYADYIGSMCAASAAWLDLFPRDDAIGRFMVALNQTAKDALAGRACHADPWLQYPGAGPMVMRIVELAKFETAVEKIPFPQ